ncbi:MAG: mannose-1-phosphate guanylyltransferase [Candidatus Omnitrophica bacterium]|nr:mannose-1-phosphate guanylyltransferase [Candidatus Omnitrophota bacterium]
MKKDIYAVILAGGAGTRFWPKSRQQFPKQFLPIIGNKTLLEMTCERILKKVLPGNVYIVTNKDYRALIQKQIISYKIPAKNVLYEPVGKNTAPAIAWIAGYLNKMNPDALMMVLPSDHYIRETRAYLKIMQQAIDLAQKDYLVTLGIVPTRPDTGYGYLKVKSTSPSKNQVLKVEKFTEKPTLPVAKRFLRAKKYLWNSGMFIWKAAVILDEFERHLPRLHWALSKGVSQRGISRKWKGLPGVSIDYGILEKAKNVVAVPALKIGWSDLGSWESLYDQLPKDRQGNVLKGDVLALNARNSFVWSEKRLVGVIDAEHLIVIDTPDALLVCPRESAQKVRAIIDILKKKKSRLV